MPRRTIGSVSALDGFSPATRDWFRGAFAAPTAAQEGAWAAAQAGRHALVVAPTGSGKTLAAFLWALDRLAADEPPADPRHRCRVLYVSPLKALAVDVQRNLRAPLTGHPAGGAAGRRATARHHGRDAHRRHPGGRAAVVRAHAAGRAGHHARIALPAAHLGRAGVAARGAHGDPGRGARGRGHQARRPPGTVAGAARRAARRRPAQRIGLSATVRPLDEVATFLAGARPVEVVQPPTPKTIEVTVEVPVPDLAALDERPAPGSSDEEVIGSAAGTAQRPSIWPAVERRLLDLVRQHRSTIVFANSRRLAERLTARLNELAAEEVDEVDEAVDLDTVPGDAERASSTSRPRPWGSPGSAEALPRSWRRHTTARWRVSSGRSSRRSSRPACCPASSRRPAWSWASTWVRWTWWCRSRRRRASRPACSGWGARGTRSARCRGGSSSPSTGATSSPAPWWPSG